MKKVISKNRVPIKMWLEDCESGAIDQASNLANLPFVFKHVALMADCHRGYGMPIGGVMATKGVIVPNAVGVDIGCGMIAVKTTLTDIDKPTLKKIMGDIRKAIPVGRDKHDKPQAASLMPEIVYNTKKDEEFKQQFPICHKNYDHSLYQLGTLGGGNHFIEIQKGDDGHIWIMVHSGSRGLGKKIADHYNNLAIELNKKWHSEVPPSWDLAYLPQDSEEGKAYIREMEYGVEYALANRKLMMDRICDIVSDNTIPHENSTLDLKQGGKVVGKACGFGEMINIPHNYAALENHYGENVWVHRKGATLARKDTVGIIPGSQGTHSYIVQGRGNPESFNSCSHGAGRVLSRKKCKEQLDLKTEIKILDDLGVVHGLRNISDLDEAPGAYKDIHKVMENQKDLADILVELTPLGVVKG